VNYDIHVTKHRSWKPDTLNNRSTHTLSS